MVLCFEFVAEMVLITHQCFGCCWAVPAQCLGFLILCALGMQPGSRSELAKGTLHPIKHNAQQQHPHTPQTKGKTLGGVAFQGGCCLETGGHHSTCGRLALHHLFVPSPRSPHLLNHLYPRLWVFSLHSLPHPAVGGVNKWVLCCCRGSFHNLQEEQGGE